MSEAYQTYEIRDNGRVGQSIRCKRCGLVSYHTDDVEQHYCGRCHVSHDDIYPPSRKHWVESGQGGTTISDLDPAGCIMTKHEHEILALRRECAEWKDECELKQLALNGQSEMSEKIAGLLQQALTLMKQDADIYRKHPDFHLHTARLDVFLARPDVKPYLP